MSRTIYTIVEEDNCVFVYTGEDFRAKVICDDFSWGELTRVIGRYYDNISLTGEEIPEEIIVYRDLADGGKLKISEKAR